MAQAPWIRRHKPIEPADQKWTDWGCTARGTIQINLIDRIFIYSFYFLLVRSSVFSIDLVGDCFINGEPLPLYVLFLSDSVVKPLLDVIE